MGQDMRATGGMTCNTGMERKFGLTTLSMRESTTRGRSMGRALTYGQMGACTREIGLRIGLRDMAHTHG